MILEPELHGKDYFIELKGECIEECIAVIKGA